MKWKLLIATACLVLVVPALAAAAEPDSTASNARRRPNSLRDGAWALQYVSGDWLSNGTVYFKHHVRDDRALRFGVYFSGDTQSHDLSSDTTMVQVESGWEDRDSYTVSLELQLQQYANVSSLAHFFFAFGGFVGVSSYTRERQTESNVFGDRSQKSEQDSFSAGGLLIVGAEWFASRALSLDIEYRVSGGYRRTTFEDDSGVTGYPRFRQTDEADEWYVSAGVAAVGLGIYF